MTEAQKVHADLVQAAINDLSTADLLEMFTYPADKIAQAIRVAHPQMIERPWFSQHALVRAIEDFRAEEWPKVLAARAKDEPGASKARLQSALAGAAAGLRQQQEILLLVAERIGRAADLLEGKK